MTELEAYKAIFDACFEISVNLNDVFYYACADTEEIWSRDAKHLVPLIMQYGCDNVLIAYTAVKRQHDPEIKEHLTENFYKAKEEILKLYHDKKIMGLTYWEEHFRQELSKKLDGKEYTWSHMLKKDPKKKNFGSDVYWNVCKIKHPNIIAVGRSIADCDTRMTMKYNRWKESQAKKAGSNGTT
jgi:hypothetical protein